MAPSSETDRLIRRGCSLIAAAWLALTMPVWGQQAMTLEQVSARKIPDFAPALAGQKVTVRGQVAAPAYHFLAYTLLGIQDEKSGGVLEVPPNDNRLDRYQPGDNLEITGTVSILAGIATIRPEHLRLISHDNPPGPIRVRVTELLGFRHLGRLVETEGRIYEMGDTTAGAYLLINDRSGPYKLFIPHSPARGENRLVDFAAGDKVRVVGLSLQYCPRPPYNRWFELLVRDTSDIVRIERSWFLPPAFIASAIAGLLGIALLMWRREGRLRAQRERLRRVYQVGEEILGASSVETILKQVSTALPAILGVTRVRLYVHSRGTKTLEAVSLNDEVPASIPLASPSGGTHAGAAACFHYRTLLSIPDIARSPFPLSPDGSGPGPKSLLFVPMLSQREVVGVFELDQDDRARDFTADEQALAQHLGNQIGVAIRLLDQRSVQEQLFRTEKLAAVGRLISSVVNELEAPLASIGELAERAQHKPHACPAEREISAIATEARKTAGIVARLVSFATEQVETQPVDINQLLRNLIEFREHDWKASGIRVRDLTTQEPLSVMGSHGQLEQVFLNLMVHAEQSLLEAEEKVISVRTSVLARRLLVEIGFTAPESESEPETVAAVLGVTRSVVAGHGGEVRLMRAAGVSPRFEIDLPLAGRERATAPKPAAAAVPRHPALQVTALVIDPDENVQRQLLALLSARGYRVVPVNNADTGLELAQRMRFDLAMCSVHSPGLNWVELSERLQTRVGAFVLLSDGYDFELASDFEGDGRFVLAKPVQEADMDRILSTLEPAALSRVRTA